MGFFGGFWSFLRILNFDLFANRKMRIFNVFLWRFFRVVFGSCRPRSASGVFQIDIVVEGRFEYVTGSAGITGLTGADRRNGSK